MNGNLHLIACGMKPRTWLRALAGVVTDPTYRAELRFFDANRTKQWIELLGGSLETENLTPKATFTSKQTGPEIALGLEVRVSTKTDREQMQWLLDKTATEKRLTQGRPFEPFVGPVSAAPQFVVDFFVEENVSARRVVVPKQAGTHDGAMAFWLVAPTEKSGPVCLMETTKFTDDTLFAHYTISSYTLLASLMQFTRDQEQGILRREIPPSPPPNEYAKADETHPPSMINEYHNVESLASEFFSRPEQLLQRWGCIVFPPEQIAYFARAREYADDHHDGSGRRRVSTFAYAGWIYKIFP